MSLTVLSTSLLMVGMDLTVLHVAVPTISRQLVPSGAELVGIVDSYALTVAAGLVTCGSLGDRYGRKRILMAGFAVFGLASAGAALSVVPVQLIAARVVLGIGGAMIMSNTPAIIRVIFPEDRERTLAVGLWVGAYSVGVSVGPLLGGLLIEHLWWGSIFLVNVPIVAVALIGGARVVPESKDPRPHRWDGVGAVLSAAGLAAVVCAVQQLGEGTNAHALVWILAAVGLGLLAGFVVRQRRISHPLLDLSLFADRRFTLAAVSVMGCYGAYSGLLFLLAQRLQLVDGYSPLSAGVALAPLAVANAVGAALAPRFSARFGHRLGLSGALLLLTVALVTFSVFGSAGNHAALVAAGLGSGAVMTLGSDAMLSAARPERAGEVGAIQETSFSLGAGLGLAFLGTTLSLIYRSALQPVPGVVEQHWQTARTSLGAASEMAARTGGPTGDALLLSAQRAFDAGFSVAVAIAAAVLALLGVLVGRLLRTSAHRPHETDVSETSPPHSPEASTPPPTSLSGPADRPCNSRPRQC